MLQILELWGKDNLLYFTVGKIVDGNNWLFEKETIGEVWKMTIILDRDGWPKQQCQMLDLELFTTFKETTFVKEELILFGDLDCAQTSGCRMYNSSLLLPFSIIFHATRSCRKQNLGKEIRK